MPGIRKTMEEYKAGKLHSGSKHGPEVKSRAQAIAIGLSEERKAGHKVAPKHHSFASSNQPFGQTKEGEKAAHAIPQGHKVSGANRHDGAGRKGHDMEMHHATEHKMPHHPDKKAHATGYVSPAEGVAGHPGDMVKLGEPGPLVGHSFGPGEMPAVLRVEGSPTAGHPGMHASMGTKSHGFGHGAHQRSGVLRNSGHPGAHRIGKR